MSFMEILITTAAFFTGCIGLVAGVVMLGGSSYWVDVVKGLGCFALATLGITVFIYSTGNGGLW